MKVTTTMGGVRVERDDRPVAIQCCGCKRAETATLVEITPPAGIGTAISWMLMPNGWWARSPFMNTASTRAHPADAQCHNCLSLQVPSDVDPVRAPPDVEAPPAWLDEMAQSIKVELSQRFGSSRVKKEAVTPKPRAFDEDNW